MDLSQNKPRRRSIYLYTCKNCGGTRRMSFKKKKADKGVCRKCKKLLVDENQQKLF